METGALTKIKEGQARMDPLLFVTYYSYLHVHVRAFLFELVQRSFDPHHRTYVKRWTHTHTCTRIHLSSLYNLVAVLTRIGHVCAFLVHLRFDGLQFRGGLTRGMNVRCMREKKLSILPRCLLASPTLHRTHLGKLSRQLIDGGAAFFVPLPGFRQLILCRPE